MNARLLTTATLTFVLISGVLPAKAADPQLLGLVMPDAKVLAGVNVDQAKATPFGQYVLSQMQTPNAGMDKLKELTGFDPTRDVREVLMASNGGANDKVGLVLARGMFDPAKIAAAATAEKAITETYKGVTIIQDPKATHGIAFLDSTIVVAGDLASVKGAIDRRTVAAPLPAAIAVQVNQWSTAQDAWAISTVPLATLHPQVRPATPPNTPPGLNPILNGQGAFQSIQRAAAGVRFGALIVVTAEAQADTAQNAQSMSDALKLLASLAQMQASNDPVAASLLQSLQITASGNMLNLSVSLANDKLQDVVRPRKRNNTAPRLERRM
jgi:hypothetical protein